MYKYNWFQYSFVNFIGLLIFLDLIHHLSVRLPDVALVLPPTILKRSTNICDNNKITFIFYIYLYKHKDRSTNLKDQNKIHDSLW